MALKYGILRRGNAIRRISGEALQRAYIGSKQRHKCNACTCDVFMKCEKVKDIEKETLEKPEHYPFITCGLETYNEDGLLADFFVSECENFRTEHQRPAKDRAASARSREDLKKNVQELSNFWHD